MRPLLVLPLLAACAEAPKGVDSGAGLDPAAWLPGGETTNRLLLGGNAFLMPSANLQPADEQDFYSGNSFFNQAWVEAPASTAARDGLGPLFNARSCSGCHLRDGKGRPPESGQSPLGGLLIRLSIDEVDGGTPDPSWGGQLQDQANDGLQPEAAVVIHEAPTDLRTADGATITLWAPTYAITPITGAPDPALRTSPRVGPHMIGLGLLEAIPAADIFALADPEDSDGDGISGRPQLRVNAAGDELLGRFGWKGDAPGIPEQVAGAFAGDLGLTSRLHPADDCTAAQPDCQEADSGGDPEVEDHILDLVILYSRAVAPPVRRAADAPEVRAGQALFDELGCAACHTPAHTTGPAALAGHEGQRIFPYTDLLLHDMGPGLADDRPLGQASGQEWRTPPLWGLGLIDEVSDHTRFLHDGRARNLTEAIVWHGGEAEESRDAFLGLSAAERAALLTFVEDL
ncbi:MAG: c-type cytochrome [Deltaproteobacteria bacterium]|nr:c-type cytochrome [Deltaproteobacteria bacterium]